MRVSNIVQLGIKELRGLMRDPVMIALIIYAFTAAIYVAATALPETLHNAPISIVDEDQSPLSTRITTAFVQPYFTPPVAIDATEMDRRLDAGIDTFAIDIPPDFQRDFLAGRSPTIQINVDATKLTQAFNGNADIQTIVSGQVAEFANRYRSAAPARVDLVIRKRFNPELTRTWFGGVMEVINQITIMSVVLTGAALIREREHGTIEHLLVMPVAPLEIMISKIWSMGVVVLMVSGFSLIAVIEGLLSVPIEGSRALFMFATALQLFATTSLGISLATVTGSMPQFGLLVILALIPLQVLSGAITPRESMPEIVQNLMLATPNTHFVMAAQAILYRGAGFSVVWPQFLALLGIGAVLFTFSLRRFRGFLK